MSRTVQVTIPSHETEKLLPKLKDLEGLISLRVQKNGSVKPEGDVLSFELINTAVSDFLKIMEEAELISDEKVSITTSKLDSIIAPAYSDEILSEPHETSWEEALKGILHDSNMTLNSSCIMFLSGVVAAIGISMNSLHVVIGAMLIAPGFEPISRLSMGLVAKHKDWRNAGKDILKGYLLLILGSIAGALIIKLLGREILGGSSTYLPSEVLIEYWSTITLVSLTTSIMASIAGGLIIMSNKSILTAGVMVALALIPAASLIGMGIVAWDLQIIGKGMLRLLLEIFIVAIFSGFVFLWKKQTSNTRKMRI